MEIIMTTITFKCSEKLARQLEIEARAKDLCGSIEGPEDLSHNPAHLGLIS